MKKKYENILFNKGFFFLKINKHLARLLLNDTFLFAKKFDNVEVIYFLLLSTKKKMNLNGTQMKWHFQPHRLKLLENRAIYKYILHTLANFLFTKELHLTFIIVKFENLIRFYYLKKGIHKVMRVQLQKEFFLSIFFFFNFVCTFLKFKKFWFYN